MIDRDAPLERYVDAYVTMRRPGHLAANRVVTEHGVEYLFTRRLSTSAGREYLGIELIDGAVAAAEARVAAARLVMSQMRTGEDEDRRVRCFRFGPPQLTGGATECAWQLEWKSGARHPEYGWRVLLPLRGGFVVVRIHGTGNFAEDEAVWAETIRSIEVKRWTPDDKDARRAEKGVKQRLEERKRRRRRTRAFKQLASLLKSLPSELQYLSDPILDLAAQGMEEFDDTGDLSVFEEAIQRETDGLKMGEAVKLCKRHAEKLRDWLAKAGYESDRRVGAPVLAVSLLLKGANRILRAQRFRSKP